MQIFYLDSDPEQCAQYHCNKHVVKQIVESCQLLSTTVRLLGHDYGYKACYVNHPMRKWVGESSLNFTWLLQMSLELCKEYTFRYGKTHKTFYVLDNMPIPLSKMRLDSTPIPLCMPDDCKIVSNPVESYRKYYLLYKKHLLKYTKRDIPLWMSL
jgi:Pyrimidine dimer DNA glycosylase